LRAELTSAPPTTVLHSTLGGNGKQAGLPGNVTGTLQSSIGAFVDVATFTLSKSQMVGTLPSSIGTWKKMVTFDISSNGFTGALPQEMSAWENIKTFQVAGNNFKGPLPVLPYENMVAPPITPVSAMSQCALLNHNAAGTNAFTCPLPKGVTASCSKMTYSWVPMVDTDCAPPATYSCDSGKGTCYLDAAGSLSQADCSASCAEVKYSCNVAMEQCIVDTKAGKESLAQCETSCVKPTPAPTPPPTYKCMETPTGNACQIAKGGLSKADCAAFCVGQLYQCTACRCVKSATGIAQADCAANCNRTAAVASALRGGGGGGCE
jgi:hypothetical protein